MNTYTPRDLYVRSAAAQILLLAVALAFAATPARSDTPDAPKTHTLFMGADVSVGTDKDLYPVKDVHGTSWVVDVNGQSKEVPAKEGPINIRITPSLKLTEVSAIVADLKSERSYTFENDPTTRQTKALARSADLNAGNQAAVNQANATLVHAENFDSYVNATNSLNNVEQHLGNPIGNQYLETSTMVTNATNAANQAVVAPGSDLELYGDRGLSEGYDAMDITFEVSSERPLNNPYVVTVTRFHAKGSAPGQIQRLVYSKALNPIDAHVQRVHLVEGGFPTNFELLDFQVHLYNRGDEIATNVSQKRVPLTRDEAFEYVKMEYVGTHKGDTLPPAPAMGKLPSDLPRLLADGKYRETYYARVSKEGLADELFLDSSCTKKVEDPYLQSIVRGIRFKPALDGGKPVDGVMPLKLGQLMI